MTFDEHETLTLNAYVSQIGVEVAPGGIVKLRTVNGPTVDMSSRVALALADLLRTAATLAASNVARLPGNAGRGNLTG